MANSNYDAVKHQQNLIRYSILYEYKLGKRPPEICKNIQKIFGSNSETSLNTIKRWSKQFSMGNENLENLADATNSKSPNVTQTKLLFQLKDQVDLLYRKINAQDCCLQLVDRFLKPRSNKSKIQLSDDSQDDPQKLVDTFYKKYRFLRRKCRKLHNKINDNSSFYETLCNSLYICDNKKEETKKLDIPRRSVHLSVRLPSANSTKQTKLVDQELNPTEPDILPEEQQPVACGQCGKVVKNKERLLAHVKSIHERIGRFYCPYEGCTANYSIDAVLSRHIRVVHTKQAIEHRCSYCPYVTHTGTLLRKHVNRHTGERPFKCIWPGCDRAFGSRSSLDTHRKIHQNQRSYRCKRLGCQSDFNTRTGLNRHMKNVHGLKQTDKKETKTKNKVPKQDL